MSATKRSTCLFGSWQFNLKLIIIIYPIFRNAEEMTHSEEDTATMSTKMSSETAEGAPVSPSGSSDANHNLNKPLLTSCSSMATTLVKAIREDVVASDFLSARRPSPTTLLAAAEMEEVEDEEDAMDEEDDEEEQTSSRETRLRDNDNMNKYLHRLTHTLIPLEK